MIQSRHISSLSRRTCKASVCGVLAALTVVATSLAAGQPDPPSDPPSREHFLTAVRDGNVERVRQLLTGIDAAGRNDGLLWAAERSQVAVARLLIEAGADVNLSDHLDGTPLHVAAMRGPVEMVQLFLRAGASIQGESVRNGPTPLHAAADSGKSDIAYVLIQAGAVVDADPPFTPLVVASKYGNTGVIDVLLAAGADANPDGMSALHWAPTVEVAQRLIAAGADVNAKDDRGRTPLHLMAFWGPREAVVRLLITHGSDVNARDTSQSTPVHEAVRFELPKVVTVLIDAGADVNAKDDSANTPFSIADEQGHTEILRMLTEAGAHDALPPLLKAGATGDRVLLNELIAAGENVNQIGPHRTTALHMASANGHALIVEALIGANANVKARDEYDRTPLHLARGKAVAVALIEAGADITPLGSHNSQTPLFAAAIEGRREVVEVLLDRGKKTVPKELVSWVTFFGQADVLELLLNRGGDANDRLDTESALLIAAQGGVADMVSPDYVTAATKLKMARMLIRAGADVNARGSIGFFEGYWPLHGAAEGASADMVQLLLDNSADVNVAGAGEYYGGLTPLHLAVLRDKLDVAELLIHSGADVNAKAAATGLHAGKTPLDLAQSDAMRSLLRR